MDVTVNLWVKGGSWFGRRPLYVYFGTILKEKNKRIF